MLVVEDNPIERQLVSKILRNAGFSVMGVDCGEIVMPTVLDHSPDIILLDALLPDIDGFDVCIHLRENPRSLHIPVIMLTGLDDVASIDRAYEVGATDFFTKPINHPLLVHRIRYLLRARQINDQLRISEQSLTSVQRIAKLGHWEYNLEKQRYRVSEELYSLYRLPSGADNTNLQPFLDRCHPEDLAKVSQAIEQAIRYRRDARLEHRILVGDVGEQCRNMDLHISVIEDQGGQMILAINMDITERKAAENEILRLAYCDRLTDLPNRSLLELCTDQAIPSAHIKGGCLAFLVIDLDLFNRVNNSMGHAAGDAILQQLAGRMQRLLAGPETDFFLENISLSGDYVGRLPRNMIARISADTFVIALNQVQRQSGEVEQFALRIKESFVEPFVFRGQELFITGSIGIAYSESGGTTAETMIQQGDLALHEAKMQGRNEIRQYSGDLVAKVSTHMAIQTDLRRAIEKNEFIVFYQPKVAIASGQVCGFEALVRWQHPSRGMVSPFEFISIAEETGQIVEIGRWVLDAACLQLKQWLDAGLVDATMAVNVSARQFRKSNLVEMIECALAASGLEPGRLELEITEGVLMADVSASEVIEELRNMGVSIALDDFGTGFSSLSYITQFPIDTIKIDRSFVQGIADNSEKIAIVEAVTNLSHSLGFSVVVEGVESLEELEVIDRLGCDQVQGYYYCKPIPAELVPQWLAQQARGTVSCAK